MQLIVSSTVILPFLLLSFGQDKNVEYFMNNQSEISVTLKECDASLEYAIKAKDEQRFKEISEDSECKSAKQARAMIRHQELLVEEREREAKVKQFYSDKDDFERYLQALDLPELKTEAYRLANECGHGLRGGTFSVRGNNTFECRAFSSQQKQISSYLITDIVNTRTYTEIKVFTASDECSKSPFQTSYECTLYDDALKQSYERKVDAFSQDKSLVTQTYNQCVDTYHRVKKEQGYKEGRKSIKTEQCQIAKQAVKKLALLKSTQMNFKTKIE